MKKIIRILKIAGMIYRHESLVHILKALANEGYLYIDTLVWYQKLDENADAISATINENGVKIQWTAKIRRTK